MIFILFLLSTTPTVNALPPFDAEYDLLKGIVKVGVMKRHFAVTPDQRYVFESKMETRGLVALFARRRIIESSTGRLEHGRLVPDSYSFNKNDTKKDYTLAFDHAGNEVVLASSGAPQRVAMPVGTLDKLSYQAQMMVDVEAAESSLTYLIAGRGEVDEYILVNRGRAAITTELGTFDTIILERQKAGSKRRTTVWLAEALAWMPIKVEYVEKDGGLTTAMLTVLRSAP